MSPFGGAPPAPGGPPPMMGGMGQQGMEAMGPDLDRMLIERIIQLPPQVKMQLLMMLPAPGGGADMAASMPMGPGGPTGF